MTDGSAPFGRDESPFDPGARENDTTVGAMDTSAGVDDNPPVSSAIDRVADEDFRRYWNSLYRVMTMAGAGLVLVLGIAGALISRTLSPAVPMAWTVLDLVVTAVLFVWYILGMRCHLDLYDDRVEVSTKARTVTISRADIESIDSDSGWWSAMQPSGRTVVITSRDDKKIRSHGALPSDALGQARVLEELQAELGRPADAAAKRLEQRLEATLTAAHASDESNDHLGDTSEDTSG